MMANANRHWLGVAVVLFVGLSPFISAHGHAFGQRFDLPLPLTYYLNGAAGAVFFSFVVVAILAKVPVEGRILYRRFRLLAWGKDRNFAGAWIMMFIQGLVVVVFLLTLAAGLFGSQDPMKNILPTIVWVIWWTGMAFCCALLGNLWSLINPWSTLFSWAEALFSKLRSGDKGLSLNLNYPAWLGVWPACLLFLLFVWGELLWTENAVPANLAMAIIAYSLITWFGMFLFNREHWLQHGEAFSLVFGLLARFAPLELRATPDSNDKFLSDQSRLEVSLRSYGVGLLDDKQISTSMMAFVVLMLSTVTFDGFMGTPLWTQIVQDLPDWRPLQPILFRLEMWGVYREVVLHTAGLILFPILFACLYLAFIGLMKLIAPAKVITTDSDSERQLSTVELAAYFVLSLVPIALAYHLAHYASYLLTVGQLIIPLMSDPFGLQWDLFGTADYQINIGLVGARFVWNTAVIAIVIGHVFAVYLAHVIALKVYRDGKQALISQLPMLVLMIFYTTLSLWILAQPLIE